VTRIEGRRVVLRARGGGWRDERLDLDVELAGEPAGLMDVRAGRKMLPAGVCEIGIELFEERRGRGLGTEAVELLTGWLHANGFPRIQAGTDLDNAPMRRVFEKAGWREEGIMRAFMAVDGSRRDFVLLSHVEHGR
jgi:RimJ/RimL family protein N-acetyltransferase